MFRQFLGDLLFLRWPGLPIQAVLIVRAPGAVSEVPTNIRPPIRGTGVPAVAAGAVGEGWGHEEQGEK